MSIRGAHQDAQIVSALYVFARRRRLGAPPLPPHGIAALRREVKRLYPLVRRRMPARASAYSYRTLRRPTTRVRAAAAQHALVEPGSVKMASESASDLVRGRTIRFIWTEGPTKGSTHEHVFHDDGTVEWHGVSSAKGPQSATAEKASAERPRYFGAEVTDDVWLISYLAQSGYALTVVLNFDDNSMVGIASNDKNWFPVRGRFQVMS
jgi:hypothetical protein